MDFVLKKIKENNHKSLPLSPAHVTYYYFYCDGPNDLCAGDVCGIIK